MVHQIIQAIREQRSRDNISAGASKPLTDADSKENKRPRKESDKDVHNRPVKITNENELHGVEELCLQT